MRVAIFAHPRSGSTAIYNYIKDSLNLQGVFEPFNKNFKSTFTLPYFIDTDKLVVKFLVYPETSISDIKQLSKSFDKVIFLYREDVLSAAESLSNAIVTENWFSDYKFDNSNNPNVSEISTILFNSKKKIVNSKGFHLTYEEVFYRREGIDKLNKFLEITNTEFLHLLDIINKYRKNYTVYPKQNYLI